MNVAHRLSERVGTLLEYLFRGWALVVLALLLVFPALKGVWPGYIPIAIALVLYRARRARPLRLLLDGVAGLPPRGYYLLLLLLPAAIQVTLILFFQSEPAFDGKFVVEQAAAFAATGEMPLLSYYPPAQIWWYGLFFKLFGSTPLVAQLCQVPLSILGVYLTFLVARRCFGTAQAQVAGLCLAYYPSYLGYVLVTPYYFYLYTVMILLVALTWLRAIDTHRHAFAGGLLAGFGSLTKAVLLIAPAQAFLVWSLGFSSFWSKRVWLRLALFILGMALVIAPWTRRNTDVLGQPVLICTSGGLVLYSANNPESNGLYSEVPDMAHVQSPAEMVLHSKDCSERAVAFIRENPGRFAWLVWRKNLNTWGNETTFIELINRRGSIPRYLDPILSASSQTGWALLVVAWTVAAFRRRAPGGRARLLDVVVATVVLSTVVVYSVYEGGARHHLPLVPLLIVFAVGRLGLQTASKTPEGETV